MKQFWVYAAVHVLRPVVPACIAANSSINVIRRSPLLS